MITLNVGLACSCCGHSVWIQWWDKTFTRQRGRAKLLKKAKAVGTRGGHALTLSVGLTCNLCQHSVWMEWCQKTYTHDRARAKLAQKVKGDGWELEKRGGLCQDDQSDLCPECKIRIESRWCGNTEKHHAYRAARQADRRGMRG